MDTPAFSLTTSMKRYRHSPHLDEAAPVREAERARIVGGDGERGGRGVDADTSGATSSIGAEQREQ